MKLVKIHIQLAFVQKIDTWNGIGFSLKLIVFISGGVRANAKRSEAQLTKVGTGY
jgi:hypothetical protein